MPKKRKFPQTKYWWDYEWIDGAIENVVVESGDPKYKIVKKWPIVGYAHSEQVSKAEKLIADLNAGRIAIKQAWAVY